MKNSLTLSLSFCVRAGKISLFPFVQENFLSLNVLWKLQLLLKSSLLPIK